MPVYNWIKLSVTGNLKWVGVGANEDDYNLLLEQYFENIKDAKEDYIFNLKKYIFCTDQELQQIKSLTDQLKITQDKEVIKILQSAPFFIMQSFDDIEKDISIVISAYKSKYLKLKLKEAEYDKYISKQPDTKSTEGDWYNQIRILSKWAGHQISVRETSVLEYIVYLNNFKADAEK